jgi:uncharacterized integral membrane protein
MLLLIGPAVAVIGIVAVVFVMRHKSVEKRSMYSARRSQIEHKVRAARQRTLAPGRRAEKADKGHSFDETAAAAPVMTYEATAYASPPVAPPPAKAPSQSAWDSPVTTPVDTPAYSPPAPAYEPPPAPPAYEPAQPPPQSPPAYEPAPAAPAYEPPSYPAPAAQPEWTPSPPTPIEPERAPAEPVSTPAGAGASWSVVGESKASAEPEPAAKKKRSKDVQTGAWSLASGEAAGDQPDEEPKKPSAVIAIAQYAVLVVGLVMVLIGVVVMVANSHGS